MASRLGASWPRLLRLLSCRHLLDKRCGVLRDFRLLLLLLLLLGLLHLLLLLGSNLPKFLICGDQPLRNPVSSEDFLDQVVHFDVVHDLGFHLGNRLESHNRALDLEGYRTGSMNETLAAEKRGQA